MTDAWKLDPSGPLPIAPPEYNQRARTQASAVRPRLSHEGRRVLELAEEEARVGDSNHLGTEHIVLGILRHESGPASALLRSLGITREVFVAQLYDEEGHAPEGAIPLTPRALTIIGFAGTFTTGPVDGLHLLRGTIVESEEWLASGRPGPHHLRKVCEAVGLPWPDLDAAVSRRHPTEDEMARQAASSACDDVFVIHQDRGRAGSFGDDAEQYDRARPGYPAELVDDLARPDVRRVLDVGCGTGIAARQFAARGCVVVGVEPDVRMAGVARRHGIFVAVSPFETWDPPSEPFDLVISAQAWHWVDPAIGATKAGSVLRPGGRFAAFWNSYAHRPEVQAAFAEVYERHAPQLLGGSATLGLGSGSGDDLYMSQLMESKIFEAVEQRTYPWKRVYRRDQWLDQLPTHSDHRTTPRETLQAILAEIGAVIDGLGGQVTVDHSARLITARRIA